MLEILYDIATKEIRAWNADMSVKGNFQPKEGQGVVIFPIDPPTFDSDIYYIDFVNKRVVGNPDYVPPEPFDVRAKIASLDGRLTKLETETERSKIT